MKNPFEISVEENQEKQSLVIIATGAVMPSNLSTRLLSAKKLGEKDLNSFFAKRIETEDAKFHDPITKLDIKTFSSINKPIKVSRDKEKAKLINVDRECFSRLLVVGQKREIDLPNLLSYELSPVPPALCHLDASMRKTNKAHYFMN